MTRHELNAIKDWLYSQVMRVKLPWTSEEVAYIPVDAVMRIDNIKPDLDYGQRTKVSEDYTLDDFATILSDGLAMECAFESVYYNEDDYTAAKALLKAHGVEDFSLELVQAQMIAMGRPFYLNEVNSDKRYLLTKEKFIRGLDKAVSMIMTELGCNKLHAICNLFEEGDFFTYHNVLQYAVFGKEVYG